MKEINEFFLKRRIRKFIRKQQCYHLNQQFISIIDKTRSKTKKIRIYKSTDFDPSSKKAIFTDFDIFLCVNIRVKEYKFIIGNESVFMIGIQYLQNTDIGWLIFILIDQNKETIKILTKLLKEFKKWKM